MNNAVTILSNEKQRLESCVDYTSQKLYEIYAPVLAQRPSKNLQGEVVMVSYIDADKLSQEQREQFERYSSLNRQHRARLCVFNTYVKSLTPKETIESYDEYVEPLDNYKGVTISSNVADVDEKHRFTKFSIKVGPYIVESKENMTLEEYSALYTASLNNALRRSLGTNLSEQEVVQQIQNACAEVYLHPVQETEIKL